MTEKTDKNSKIITITLITIILIQVIGLFFIFTFLKQGHHSDEVWNYAFANSINGGSLEYDNQGNLLFEQWRDSKTFLDFISVDKEHRFSYSTNIKNAWNDLNPPFQYMVLHTICSFFPGIFSWYFCFAINIVAFIVSQIFIFKIVERITENKLIGISAVILYGFGVGAMDITIYMRIYALAVMFVTVFMYFSHRIYETRNEKTHLKHLIPLFISCFLGSYTLNLFIMVVFVITLCYTLFFLFSKHFKVFLIHGLTVLFAALLSIGIFPVAFKQVGGINETHTFSEISYPFSMELRLYLYSLTKDVLGVHIFSYANVYFVSFLVILLFICIMATPIIILIRREPWFIKFCDKLKVKIKNVFEARKRFRYSLVVLFLTIAVTIVVVTKWTSYFFMKDYSNRYIFVLYPLTVILAVSTLYFIFSFIFENKKVPVVALLVIGVAMSIWTHFNPGSKAYFFEHEEEGVTFKDLGQDARCLIVFWNDWLITCFAPDLYNTDEYYATNYFFFKNPNLSDIILTTQ